MIAACFDSAEAVIPLRTSSAAAGPVAESPCLAASCAEGGTMNATERAELVDELLRRIEERGVPQGTWLIEIGQVRAALQEADSLLRRIEDALIRQLSTREDVDA
jgi:hypothetical protein